jgi:CRP-like cAMP-binding protein
MKVFPDQQPKVRYQLLWRKVIKKVILNQKIIKLLRSSITPGTEDLDEKIRRSSGLAKSKSQVVVPFGLILPRTLLKEIWNLFIGFLLIYSALVVPFTNSFYDLQSGDILLNLDILIDISFIIDFIISLNTAYYNEENVLILSRKSIFLNYLKNGLVIDLFSSFPFSLFDATSTGYSKFLRILRLRALTKLLKLSKIFKIVGKKDHSIIKNLQDLFSFSHSSMRIIKFIGVLALCIHFTACVWHLLAKLDDYGPETWVVRSGHLDDPAYRKYLVSLYWTFVTLATIGYGDITPFTMKEKLFSVFWMMFALYFLSFSISSLSSVLSQIDLKKNLVRQKMAFIDDFSKEVNLSKRLKKELQKMLIHSIDRFNYSYDDRAKLISEFPNDLKLEIANMMQKGKVARLDLFQNEDDNLLLEVLPLMQNLNLTGCQSVYSYGESSTKIFFILKGRVHFLLKNETTVFQVFSEKGYFGDLEVIHGIPRMNSAVTATECRFIVLGLDLIKRIQKNYPIFYHKMKSAAKYRYLISKRAKVEMKALSKLRRDEIITKKEFGKIREIIRRKTLAVDLKKKIMANKMIQKSHARESLRLTNDFLMEIRDDLERNRFLIEKLRRIKAKSP